MNVCVAGWYYWPEVYEILDKYAVGHSVYVIANEPTTHYNSKFKKEYQDKYKNLRFVIGPNYGLDFGKYDYYLKNFWRGKEGVFFLHDDIVIKPDIDPFHIVKNTIKDNDLAFYFGFDYRQQCFGSYRHCRCLYISADYLHAMLKHRCTYSNCKECKDYFNVKSKKHVRAMPPHTGFFFDPKNIGVTDNNKAIIGMRDINVGVHHFFVSQWRALRANRKWKNEKILNDFINHAIRGVRPKVRENLK